MSHPVTSVTEMLASARSGDAAALAYLFPLIHDELDRLVRLQLRHEPGRHTLSPERPE